MASTIKDKTTNIRTTFSFYHKLLLIGLALVIQLSMRHLKTSADVIIAAIGAIAGILAAIIEGVRSSEKHWHLSERVVRLEERMLILESKHPPVHHDCEK